MLCYLDKSSINIPSLMHCFANIKIKYLEYAKKIIFYFQAFDRIKGYLSHAKSSPNLTVIAGGNCDNR